MKRTWKRKTGKLGLCDECELVFFCALEVEQCKHTDNIYLYIPIKVFKKRRF